MRTVFNPAYVGFIQPPGPPQPNFYNLYGSTPVGASSVSNVGTFLSGVTFKVTAGSLYLNGYRYFIADGNQPTSAQPFALWQLIGGAATTSNDYLITGSTVTSGTLALGWNYVPLATPIPLGATVEYLAATGFTGNFAFLAGQFGSGDPHSAGITNGPLFAFSDSGGGERPVQQPAGPVRHFHRQPGVPAAVSGFQFGELRHRRRNNRSGAVRCDVPAVPEPAVPGEPGTRHRVQLHLGHRIQPQPGVCAEQHLVLQPARHDAAADRLRDLADQLPDAGVRDQ